MEQEPKIEQKDPKEVAKEKLEGAIRALGNIGDLGTTTMPFDHIDFAIKSALKNIIEARNLLDK